MNKNKIYIFLLFFLSLNVHANSYYDDFYSDFHNSSKTFTDQSDMIEKNFRDPDEINLPWINALVRISKMAIYTED